MNPIHIIFSNYGGKYYIEEVTSVYLKTLESQWEVEKVIDETDSYDNYLDTMDELSNPTVGLSKQFIVIQDLIKL